MILFPNGTEHLLINIRILKECNWNYFATSILSLLVSLQSWGLCWAWSLGTSCTFRFCECRNAILQTSSPSITSSSSCPWEKVTFCGLLLPRYFPYTLHLFQVFHVVAGLLMCGQNWSDFNSILPPVLIFCLSLNELRSNKACIPPFSLFLLPADSFSSFDTLLSCSVDWGIFDSNVLFIPQSCCDSVIS